MAVREEVKLLHAEERLSLPERGEVVEGEFRELGDNDLLPPEGLRE